MPVSFDNAARKRAAPWAARKRRFPVCRYLSREENERVPKRPRSRSPLPGTQATAWAKSGVAAYASAATADTLRSKPRSSNN